MSMMTAMESFSREHEQVDILHTVLKDVGTSFIVFHFTGICLFCPSVCVPKHHIRGPVRYLYRIGISIARVITSE